MSQMPTGLVADGVVGRSHLPGRGRRHAVTLTDDEGDRLARAGRVLSGALGGHARSPDTGPVPLAQTLTTLRRAL